MPKVRYLREFGEGGIHDAEKDGYCWADLVFWVNNPSFNFDDDVGRKKNCGYCGCCSTVNSQQLRTEKQ